MSVRGPGTWGDNARRLIEKVHAENPDLDAVALRKKLRGYSEAFHCGTSWGKKVWPKACREYIVAKFGPAALPALKQARVEDSPLFNTADHHFPYRANPE